MIDAIAQKNTKNQILESATSSSACDGGNNNAEAEMERHPLGMFGLISGACLGDTFVREAMPSAIRAARAGGRDSTRSLSRAAARMMGTTTSRGG